MNVVLLKYERTNQYITSSEIGLKYNPEITKRFKLKNVCVYEVIDKQLFFLSVIKHNIEFEEIKC